MHFQVLNYPMEKLVLALSNMNREAKSISLFAPSHSFSGAGVHFIAQAILKLMATLCFSRCEPPHIAKRIYACVRNGIRNDDRLVNEII